MERQAKDGTFYKSVGPDEWEMVTRQAKDGTVYKKVETDGWEVLESANKPQESRMLEAGLNAFTGSATAGYAPELYAGTQQAIETVGSNIPFLGDQDVDENVYQRSLNEYNQRSESLEAQHPTVSTVGNVAGYLLPAMGIAKGAQAVRAGLGMAPQAATLAGKAGVLAGEGAVMGVAQRPSTPDDIINIPERIQSGVIEGTIGAALPYAFKGLGETAKTIAKAPKKLLGVLGGVDEKTINAFLKDPDRYLNAKSKEETLETLKVIVSDINEAVSKGKVSVDEAKGFLKEVGNQIKGDLKDSHQVARDYLTQEIQGMGLAKADLTSAYAGLRESLGKTKPPTHLASEIGESLTTLKKEVSEKSAKSFDVLAKESKGVPIPVDENLVKLKYLDAKEQDTIKHLSKRMKVKIKDIAKYQKTDSGPYVKAKESNFKVFPNYGAKPSGVIGEKAISNTSKTVDPLHYGIEHKYGATKKLIEKHGNGNLEINTSSDLIARDDYLELMSSNTKVNIYLSTQDDVINRLIFTSNTSRKRQLNAIKRLKENGINAKGIEPTPQSIIDAVGLDKIKKSLGLEGESEVIKALTKVTRPQLGIVGAKVEHKAATNEAIRKQTLRALKEIKPEKLKKTSINSRPAIYALKRRIKDLTTRSSDDSKAAKSKLEGYLSDIEGKSKNYRLNAVEAKKIIQDLGADVQTWESKKLGGFDDAFNRELKGLRWNIDKQLKKEFKEYRKIMEELAPETKFLNKASKEFGDFVATEKKLMSIDKPTNISQRRLLKTLGKKTGKDFDTPIKEYAEVQRKLHTPSEMLKIKKALPEYAALTDAEKAVYKAKQADKTARLAKDPRNFQKLLKATKETKLLKTAQESLDDAQKVKDVIKGWTDASVEGKLNSAIRGRDHINSQLKNLSEMSEHDLVKMVEDLRVNEPFTKEFRIGSRNVNMISLMAIGVFGAGPLGLFIGALLGGTIDKYGPRMTKSILKAMHKLNKTKLGIKSSVVSQPTVKKLMSYGLPKKVASEITDSFYEVLLMGVGDIERDRQKANLRGKEKWSYRGWQKLKLDSESKGKKSVFNDYDKSTKQSPEIKKLLIKASDYSVGTVGFENIMNKVKRLMKEGK